MISFTISRRTNILAILTVFCLFIFYHGFRLYQNGGIGGSLISDDAHAEKSLSETLACRVWPDWTAPTPVYGELGSSRPPIIGDAATIGRKDLCMLSQHRLTPYSSTTSSRNWSDAQWGTIQRRCAAHTYGPASPHPPSGDLRDIWYRTQIPATPDREPHSQTKPRSAIVLRTWDNYDYSDSRLSWLRALISETALYSSGEYEVFLLVNVKEADARLEDEAVYAYWLQKTVPQEFYGMALLFNERFLREWYPKIKEHGAQDQMYQALQIFSQQFQQFEFVWQLEMDLRLTGHAYETLTTAATFARNQPRENLWERNGRFYIPELHDHSYEKFTAVVKEEVGDTGVWGAPPTTDFTPQGPQAPIKSVVPGWGVGEDADLISFMPMIDPIGTNWVYEDRVYGFADGELTPRRAAFVSMTRSSRSLLHLVHKAQSQNGQWLVSEATLETFSLLHGLKAVSVPHPIVFGNSNDMSAHELDQAIHKGPKHSKAGGHNPSLLYTKQGYMDGPWGRSSYWWSGNDAPKIWHRYLNGECLPPMLLHPVKD